MISSITSQSYSSYSIQKSYQAKETSLDKVSTSSYTNPTSFGFKTDDKGFIEPKLNEMAGIPTFIKIHTKTFDQITKYAHNTKSGLNPVQGLSKIWNFFSNLTGNSVDLSSNKTLNENDISNMACMYTSDGTILGNVTGIYKTQEEQKALGKLNQITNYTQKKMSIGYGIFFGGVAKTGEIAKEYVENVKDRYKSNTKSSENLPKGNISIGELFGDFVHTGTKYFPNGRTKEVQNYYNFLKSGKSLEEYLKDTFGDNHIKGLKTSYSQYADDKKLAGNLFDVLINELSKANKDFYAQNIDFIQNHDMSDFKKFDNFKLDLKAGNILNLDV